MTADNSVLGRAALILSAFEQGEPVLSLADLSAHTGLPKSTVHRFAEQFLELGWFERAVGGYRIGLRLFEVGGLADRRKRLADRAAPHLQQLAARTRWSVHLGVLDGSDVIYLAKLPIRGLEVPTRDGGRMPANCTGLGKAMLAFAPEEQVADIVNRGLERRTRASITHPEVLRRELAAIRESGVAYDREEACPGVSCVAAPIRGSGRAVGAVSVTGFTDRFDVAAVEPLVRGASQSIWQDLFGSPPDRDGTRRAAVA
jgi:DNA-binding IclR family transcriptional regulator